MFRPNDIGVVSLIVEHETGETKRDSDSEFLQHKLASSKDFNRDPETQIE